MYIVIDEEFKKLEDAVYECLYEQEICEISDCKYFDHCEVCKRYIELVERKFPLFSVK